MPEIARIEAIKNVKGFYNVTFSNADGSEQSLEVQEDVLVQAGLHKGQQLSSAQYTQLLHEAGTVLAYRAGLRFLSYRMRSKMEMRGYLQKKMFTSTQIMAAMERFSSEKLLDDRAFALSFVRTRMELSTKGPQLVYRELLQAGIAQDIAEAACELYSADVQLDHARKYLAKQAASVKNKKSAAEARLVLSRLLMQRGYEQAVSAQVIEEIADFLADNEKNALIYQAEKAAQKYKKLSGDDARVKIRAYLYQKGFSADAITALLSDGDSQSPASDWG
ncbi:MAG: RecX family transcriptional regulator [Sporolactobacillus sp.]